VSIYITGKKTILPLLSKYVMGHRKHLRKHALLLLRDYAVIAPLSAHADLVVLNVAVDKKDAMSQELRDAIQSDDEEDDEEEEKKQKKMDTEGEEKESRRARKRSKNVNFFEDVFHIKRTRVLNALRMVQSPQVLAQLRSNTINRVLIPFLFAEFVKSVPIDVRQCISRTCP
jgi:hypothetical protein